MANFKLFPGGVTNFGAAIAGNPYPVSQGVNPLKPAGHQSRGYAFLHTILDFGEPNRYVQALRNALPVVAANDTLDVLVLPQRSLILGAVVAVDVPIAGFTFGVSIVDDDTTGPVLDYAWASNGLNTVDADYAASGSLVETSTADDAPGTDTAGSAYTIVATGAPLSAATAGQSTYAIPIANQANNEQSLLRLTAVAVPSSPSLANLTKGRIAVGVWVLMGMFQGID